MSTTLSVAEAQDKLSQLLELAQADHEIIIQAPQKGQGRLVPVAAPASLGPRRFGLHEGEVWMSDDFNALLPDAFWQTVSTGKSSPPIPSSPPIRSG